VRVLVSCITHTTPLLSKLSARAQLDTWPFLLLLRALGGLPLNTTYTHAHTYTDTHTSTHTHTHRPRPQALFHSHLVQKRHRADTEVNNSMCRVLRLGTFVTVRWKHVVVGDIVKVTNGQFFPADLVLLASSEPHAMCYIETANLDGETNLKMRQGLPLTAALTTSRDMRFLSGRVDCEPPNSRVDKFVGNIAAGAARAPLGPDQLLLRGAQLRSTPWIFGLVVYTGHDSKLLRNATAAPIKRSNVDEVTNRQILLLFVALMLLALISTVSSAVWTSQHESGDWYLGFSSQPPQNIALTFLTFMVLYNNLIPISLIVTLEVVKFVQALTFINGDRELYDEPSDTPARARTSTLNEELGQVCVCVCVCVSE
jgi:phospholipid-transporting ATPase